MMSRADRSFVLIILLSNVIVFLLSIFLNKFLIKHGYGNRVSAEECKDRINQGIMKYCFNIVMLIISVILIVAYFLDLNIPKFTFVLVFFVVYMMCYLIDKVVEKHKLNKK